MRYLALALVLVSCAPLATTPAASSSSTPTAAAAPSTASPAEFPLGFDGERAHQHLAYLADPARGGRFSGSPGF